MEDSPIHSWRDVACDLLKFHLDIPYYIYLLLCSVLNLLRKAFFSDRTKCLDHEIILVTGSAVGIGREAVLKFAKISSKVTLVLWDINEKGLLETSEECRKLGVGVFSYVVDLSKHEEIIVAAAKVRADVGNITILFNNAGYLQCNAFLDASHVHEEKIIQVNLLSYMWTIREFLPGMIKRGKGHIVSTCSGLACCRFRYLSAYTASKYGLKGFFECLKLELRIHANKPDIKFSTVYPGWVKTNMTTGITWKARYKTWNMLKQLDPVYFAERMVDGILKEKEEIMIPGWIGFLARFYALIPTQLTDSVERFVYKDIQVTSGSNCMISRPTILYGDDTNKTCSIALFPSSEAVSPVPDPQL